ncbi:MAG: CCE_0567 family metalloprotein [Acetobacteraceae bacterium]|nr:CCE_0567 family metalloprotein [Acetobacteraceae bacterium]
MSDVETLKAELKKLSSKATSAKMDLHDLSEELPKDWERIPEVASRAHAIFAELTAKRAELKRLEALAS